MTLCCCPCFASSVASWTSWRRVASLCSCPCITSRHGLLGVTSHHVVSRRSCHALHVVASHRFASRIVVIAMDRFFLGLACRRTLVRVSQVCGNLRKVWWRSLHSGQSPHDGGERFFTLGLTRNGNGLCNYCKVNVCAFTIRFAVIVTLRTPHCLGIVLSPLALLIVRRL